MSLPPLRLARLSRDARFRGATYEIEVEKPVGICTGVREVRVNGRRVEGNLVPATEAGETVSVQVRMG